MGESFSRIHADVAIMSGGGISLDGITNCHGLLIDIQRAMTKASQRVIFRLDHTKLGRRSVLRLCSLEPAHTIVADSAAPDELVQALLARGLNVIIVLAFPSRPRRQLSPGW